MDSKVLMELADTYGARNYKPLPVVIDKAEGVWVFDVEGNKYLDFLSCYSAVSHGHRHQALVDAAIRQIGRVTVTSRAFHNSELGPFMKELCEFTGMEMALPMNSGAEAVETAIKAVRKWAYVVKGVPKYDAEIIVCSDNFHGRTTTVVSFSTEELYKEAFGPFTPGFKVIPFGDADALEKAITPNTAAFLVEPIQGEAGVVLPPDGFLARAAEICRSNNVLFVADEIQTGFGRTGRRFAVEHEGVKPDLMCLGKALGGGVYPVSAVVGSRDVLGLFVPGEHGSTFGGNPVACAVGRAALKVMLDEDLTGKSAENGQYLIEKLASIKSKHIKQIRGRGLFVGMVLHPEAGGARRFCEALMKRGLLCKETHDNVIRFAPPLVITREQIDWAISEVTEVMTTL
ncbi:MAG TPA: ornithine--oxo-acid transaminase [Myxococcota bacterium]|nr:ornithine--oxo-acid transaminase [Myxococcota bacterium]HOA12557.1 ornithine--oxo-acid transaminase [Myxococcota bacterium]HOC98978.1 ornithine--oxo-acid transaminase [Myxococcota bacterium]HOH76476.1 ornithine--oxo-acid transaminase [Myxococcota bacterium]HPV03549.1 ornithine--oxo-acid transaminase [Myxococcota bacterium]